MFGNPALQRARLLRQADPQMLIALAREQQAAQSRGGGMVQPTSAPMAAAGPMATQAVQAGQAHPPANEEITVRATSPTRSPYDAGPLAMDRAGQAVKTPEMNWGDRLQVFGATLQQMADPRNQIADTSGAIRANLRGQAEREEAARLAAAQLAGVRKIIDQERLAWERTTDTQDAPKPDWEQTWVMQAARLAQNPDEFMRLYFARQEAEAGRTIQRNELALRGELGRGELAQGGRRLDLTEKQIGNDFELGKGRLAVDQRNAGTAAFEAQTRRRAQENDLATGVKDPITRELIKGDVGLVQQYESEAQNLTAIASRLGRFGALNQQQPTGFMAPGTPIAGINPNANFQQMQVIQNELFPVLGEAIKGVLSETDSARIERGTVHVDNSSETNQAIVQIGMEAARRAQERAQLSRAFLQRDRSLADFNADYNRYVLETPATSGKTFAQWKTEQSGAGQRLTPEQASRLPSGTRFIGADGVERVRQ